MYEKYDKQIDSSARNISELLKDDLAGSEKSGKNALSKRENMRSVIIVSN
jgi:hypothetical protein